MTGIDAIKASLETSHQWFMALMSDVQDALLTAPTPKGGNHPLWALGHVVYSEASLVNGFVLGKPNPLARWEHLFDMGSQPIADAGKYPSVAELLSEFERVRTDTLKVLSGFTDADLDSPSKAPAHLKDMFGTIGQCFVTLGMHTTFHGGEVADARRAAGKKPVFG
jgi:hypothetical protein